MSEWKLKDSDLKKYPHFDSRISANDAMALATDPGRVAEHPFYPFMLYKQRWNRFAKKGGKGKSKERPIRYAARRDAYIFSRYRHVLSERYEVELRRLSLEGSILAYRRIPTDDGTGGKCNIHFARDAFSKIREIRNCSVIALDISSFFESLDHMLLKEIWCRILEVKKLPPDHFKVFSAITRYSVVDKERVYERLGHYGPKKKSTSGKIINGYLTPHKEIPKQLCSGKEFREKIAGDGVEKTIIRKNYKKHGIPQGAPISDLLANLYLLDFDQSVKSMVDAVGGSYYRYSDDILIIVPGGNVAGWNLMARVRTLIGTFGSEMKIKEDKSSLFVFEGRGDYQAFRRLHGTQGRNGLEYLGFRYDGRGVYLRDSTLASLRRKVARAAHRDAEACARRYPDKDASQLRARFNYERLVKKFGKVEDFGEKQHDYKSWTFWTYAKRAAEIFDSFGKPIVRQLRRHSALVRQRADKELEYAVTRREKRKLP